MINDGLPSDVKQKIIGILNVLFPEAKIYLFGSRASGTFREYSDIDLALDVGIGKERLALQEAKDLLAALNMPYKVDLVDLQHVNENLRSHILKEGIL